MIDLRQLQALSAVAAEGSVARAASRLGWSQPTVDYHLRNLDRLVGTALTTRSSRGSALTSAGTLMLERGTEILALADRALADVRELAEVGRVRLRFGLFPTAAAHLLPGIAGRLAELGIELDAVLEEVMPLVSRVNQHTLDAALVYSASGYELPLRAEVHTTHIFSEPLLLALPASHPAASHSVIDLDTMRSLSTAPWVLGSTPGDTLDDIVRDVFASGERMPTVAIRTDDYSVVLGMVSAGLVVGLVPQLAAEHLPPGVVLRPIDDPRFTREIVLAAPGSASGPEPAVRQLAEAIRRTVATLG